nr:MAG TPA: major capsid protein [Microviridae sp.]
MALSRNAESRFAVNPTHLDISRSRFDRTSTVKTSFNVGDLVPFYVDEVLPGDTFDVSTAKVVRMQPMVAPPMDDLFLDTYYFFVPNRLVWDHWTNLMGENDTTSWYPTVEYSVPQLISPHTGGWNIGTIGDYFGIPTGVPDLYVNALPFRAYAKIVNDWFRDENIVDPAVLTTGDATVQGSNGDGLTAYELGGKPFVAAKLHDYFSSCLPEPQKGNPVTVPVANVSVPIDIPVTTSNTMVDGLGLNTPAMVLMNGPLLAGGLKGYISSKPPDFSLEQDVDEDAIRKISGTMEPFMPANLRAIGNAVGSGFATSINELRMAFQMQKLLERDARGGTRYIEMIKSHFGVTSPDARLQRSEYLGGNRIRINVNQIVQQSATTTGSTPQGNPVGLSVTHDNADSFTRSFTEHGFVIGLMCARYPHTYQQGLERFWSRKTRFDYYFPVFANIGEMAVLNKELYATGTDSDYKAFGYQEAWADYRYKPSRVSGEMRSAATKSLDVWHFADYYNKLPTLSPDWIKEDKKNVDRVLAVSSKVSNQLWADIVINNRTSRPMPLYSVPGLIDHH